MKKSLYFRIYVCELNLFSCINIVPWGTQWSKYYENYFISEKLVQKTDFLMHVYVHVHVIVSVCEYVSVIDIFIYIDIYQDRYLHTVINNI